MSNAYAFEKNSIFLGCVIYSGNVALDKSLQYQRVLLHLYLKAEVSLQIGGNYSLGQTLEFFITVDFF